MSDETPLIDTIADMTAASVVRANLSPEVLMLVRLAALAAVDAPASSYVLNIAAPKPCRPARRSRRPSA